MLTPEQLAQEARSAAVRKLREYESNVVQDRIVMIVVEAAISRMLPHVRTYEETLTPWQRFRAMVNDWRETRG